MGCNHWRGLTPPPPPPPQGGGGEDAHHPPTPPPGPPPKGGREEELRPPLVHLTWRMVVPIVLVDVILICAVAAAVASYAYGAPPRDAAADVRAVLDAQEAAWNRGDLDGFMVGYWKSDQLTFYSGDAVTRGWQATYDRYRKRYQADGKEMGRLQFRDVTVEPLGDAALARGRWHLTMKD